MDDTQIKQWIVDAIDLAKSKGFILQHVEISRDYWSYDGHTAKCALYSGKDHENFSKTFRAKTISDAANAAWEWLSAYERAETQLSEILGCKLVA